MTYLDIRHRGRVIHLLGWRATATLIGVLYGMALLGFWIGHLLT